uniref:Uncharacterized protein n=1 Tax=Bracon brevicornis TaxID=1563983 RepID=A0A6V7HV84_9HYME
MASKRAKVSNTKQQVVEEKTVSNIVEEDKKVGKDNQADKKVSENVQEDAAVSSGVQEAGKELNEMTNQSKRARNTWWYCSKGRKAMEKYEMISGGSKNRDNRCNEVIEEHPSIIRHNNKKLKTYWITTYKTKG